MDMYRTECPICEGKVALVYTTNHDTIGFKTYCDYSKEHSKIFKSFQTFAWAYSEIGKSKDMVIEKIFPLEHQTRCPNCHYSVPSDKLYKEAVYCKHCKQMV